ncbi:hypothetical protein ZIOFF_046037 [Zingiber officinale]|uniref:Neprosin PEP catalytic domain-containing protein n=1 Tax=Zingiber officinale TaxID=94328 RepID=A0A8J5KS86_ZINOF|nr:hypothetical protein ZIOFF_046037 [Zingiber officinale]
MASMCLIYLSLLFSLLLCSIEGRNNIPLTVEEDLELENELQSLNKPPVKVLKSFTGDLFDCIQMYKQPAFDHPALKNHKLQIRPSFQTKNDVNMDEKFKPVLDPGFNDTCPLGTVLIRRTRKEDLIIAKELPKYFRNYGSRYHVLDSSEQNYYAIAESQNGRYHGFESKITTWALPNVGPNQVSQNQVWMMGDVDGDYDDLNVIQTGWHDPQSGNWWLAMDRANLGYWPKELFPNLDVSKLIQFGGQVRTPNDVPSPPMGNGHFPQEGYDKASFFLFSRFIGEDNQAYTPGEGSASLKTNADAKYYQIAGDPPSRGDWDVAYGGPGGLVAGHSSSDASAQLPSSPSPLDEPILAETPKFLLLTSHRDSSPVLAETPKFPLLTVAFPRHDA